MKKDKKQNKNTSLAVADSTVSTNSVTSADTQPNGEPKMTIYDYEHRYVKHQNLRSAKFIIGLVVGIIGVFLVWCLFSITMKVYDIHPYAGYAAAGVSVLLFIFLYIVPVVKILKSDYFITNVNSKTAAQAKRHNRELRRSIAEKIVDFNSKVEGVGWYDGQVVDELELHLKANDNEGIKRSLTTLYQGKVKKSAHDIIFKCSLKSGMYAAVSQSDNIDAALVAVVNLQMIKDIVFLYGFRPSDVKLVKIFAAVLRNSLIAYGLSGAQVGNGIVKSIDFVRDIPILGTAVATLVDSSVQGLTNGILTAIIGYQTIRYLNTEYKLQDILDGIDVGETEEEFESTCKEIETELRKGKKQPKAV
jgi:uncharacterized membrane protein YcjF (UPF0283 family)